MTTKYLWAGLLFTFCISTFYGQYGALDVSLNPGSGADASIQVIALQPDNKILIGGDFVTFDGIARKRLARLNADGSVDTNFSIGSGFNNIISSVMVQPDGKIVVMGAFTTYNNTSKKRIMRLNSDGSNDSSFNTGYGANNSIECGLIEPDGKIMVGGMFSSMNWIARNGIARLNADGSLDNTFDYAGEGSEITNIIRQPDGKYIINAINKIIRLNNDGTIDASFYSGTGTDYPIQALELLSDGKILVGGYFNQYDNISFGGILRLDADGMIDTTFNYGVAADYGVLEISEQPDGKILISGMFSNFDGMAREKIARLNADGTLDETLNPMLGPNNIVLHHAIQPDGMVVIAGDFDVYNGVVRNKIARISGFTSTLAIQENQATGKIAVYPNPVAEILNVTLPDNMQAASVSIADMTGKIVYSASAVMSGIDVGSLGSGIYTISISDNGNMINSKFIKQ